MTADSVLVGVTGHRFLAEVEKLRAAVEEALDRIRSAFPRAALALLSPLAEGADRLVAEAVLERGGTLVVPLPLPVDDYMSDFETEESRAQFGFLLSRAAAVIHPSPAADRDEAYEQVGMYVLDNCNVLIALYDGQAAQGRGGTADIVARALDRAMPVIHIKAGNRDPRTGEPTSLGDEQGALVMHNLGSGSDR